MCVFLSLELGKQKGELTDIILSPKIFKDKLSLMHLETWIYYILKKSGVVYGKNCISIILDYPASGLYLFNLCHFLYEDIPNMGHWV